MRPESAKFLEDIREAGQTALEIADGWAALRSFTPARMGVGGDGGGVEG